MELKHIHFSTTMYMCTCHIFPTNIIHKLFFSAGDAGHESHLWGSGERQHNPHHLSGLYFVELATCYLQSTFDPRTIPNGKFFRQFQCQKSLSKSGKLPNHQMSSTPCHAIKKCKLHKRVHEIPNHCILKINGTNFPPPRFGFHHRVGPKDCQPTKDRRNNKVSSE